MSESLCQLFFFVIFCVWRVELVLKFVGIDDVFYFVVNKNKMDFVVILQLSCNVYYKVYDFVMILGLRFYVVVDGIIGLDVEDSVVNGSIDVFCGLRFVCLV